MKRIFFFYYILFLMAADSTESIFSFLVSLGQNTADREYWVDPKDSEITLCNLYSETNLKPYRACPKLTGWQCTDLNLKFHLGYLIIYCQKCLVEWMKLALSLKWNKFSSVFPVSPFSLLSGKGVSPTEGEKTKPTAKQRSHNVP